MNKFFILLIVIIILLGYTIYINKNVIEKMYNYDINYLYWTGGYDSTFRLCELLIIHKKKVQPIYVSYNLDSENSNDYWVRKNRKNEFDTMNKIKQILFIRFPYTKCLLKPTLFINNNLDNKEYENRVINLSLWPKKRKVHQYVHLAKISYFLKINIELGILGIDRDGKFIKFIEENINSNYSLNLPKNHPLYYLSFPLFKKTKKDLCKIAKQNNFDDIIRNSWSCWFPKNDVPCKKCPMCRQRFTC